MSDRTLIIGHNIFGLNSYEWNDLRFLKENLGRYDHIIIDLDSLEFELENTATNSIIQYVEREYEIYHNSIFYINDNNTLILSHLQNEIIEDEKFTGLITLLFTPDLSYNVGDGINLKLSLFSNCDRLKSHSNRLGVNLINTRINLKMENEFNYGDLIIDSDYEDIFDTNMKFTITFRDIGYRLGYDLIAYSRWKERVAFKADTTNTVNCELFQIPSNYTSRTFLLRILSHHQISYDDWMSHEYVQSEETIELMSKRKKMENKFQL